MILNLLSCSVDLSSIIFATLVLSLFMSISAKTIGVLTIISFKVAPHILTAWPPCVL